MVETTAPVCGVERSFVRRVASQVITHVRTDGWEARTGMNRDLVIQDVISILREMTNDWEIGYQGEIGPKTTLIGDLAFESIDVVQLVMALQEHFGQENLPFEKLLMTEGRYVDDLGIDAIVTFLCEHIRR